MLQETNTTLKAEAYFLTELASLLTEYDDFVVSCEGNQQRGYAREVIGTREFRGMRQNRVIDLIGLVLSKNGMYHLLPEYMFIPFSLGNTATNTYEIVQEVKKNRQRETDAKTFFAPFDTETFQWRTLLLQRYLEWPFSLAPEALVTIATALTGKAVPVDQEKLSVWLELLTHSESVKDDPELLSQYLQVLLNRKVEIQPVRLPQPASPVLSLGASRLGVSAVLDGYPTAELTDWQITLELRPHEIQLEVANQKWSTLTREILGYFVLAGRELLIKFQTPPQPVSLAEGVLGMDTYLMN